jgi:aminoglycoside/choline kinase family phosphotransferase
VTWADGASEVLAVYPGPIEYATLPFADVLGLLGAMNAPVPRVVAHSDALGIVALDDLGDVTLQTRVRSASPETTHALYAEAVDLINELQTRGAAFATSAHVPYTLAFDTPKLSWELDFFVAHFLEAHRGAAIAPADRTALDEEFHAIAAELAAEPRVLCHRDYHSRNLMVHGGRLWMIDFQDARLGPDTYDLASLLRDSYVDLDPALVEEMIERFAAGRRRAGAPTTGFRQRFDLMALQRNLKALGTFGFQTARRGSTVYLESVPRTLAYARNTLMAYGRFTRLHQLLAAHLPELR